MKSLRAILLAVVVAVVMLDHVNAAGSSCETLLKLMPENATITLAELVPAGAFKAPTGGNAAQNASRFAELPAFCRVAATVKPTTDSDIKVEV